MALALAAALGCGEDRTLSEQPDGPAPATCPEDTSFDADSAVPLEDGVLAEGYICPVGDVDFFSFAVPGGDDLALVELGNAVPLSTVDLGYSLLDPTGTTSLAATGDPNGADGITSIAHHHRAPGGAMYVVAVSDLGNDEEDVREPYGLTVSAAVDPDKNEPNDTTADATPLGAGASGYIAFFGDVDVFAADLPAGSLWRLRLDAPDIATGLRLRWTDAQGAVLWQVDDATGEQADAGVETLRAIPAAATYYVDVAAWDGVSEDFDTPYTIEASVEPDPDPNEIPMRNDTPATATVLAPPFDGSGEVAVTVDGARIASAGDLDYYQVDTNLRAIVEIELTGPAPVDWSLQILASDPGTPCTADSECAELAGGCEENWECLSSACAASGFCQGAGLCLPQGLCGVTQFARTVAGGATLATAQPLLAAGRYYIVVADAGGDEWSADPYALAVTLRGEPDANEPNDDYDPYPLVGADVEPSLPLATTLPIGAVATGYIAYEADTDWFRVALPCCSIDCPCAETADVCGLEIAFGSDSGGVSFRFEVWGGSPGGASLWANFDEGSAGSAYGDESCECLFWTRFLDVPAQAAYVRVRDEGADDWDAEQSYWLSVASSVGSPSPGCVNVSACEEDVDDPAFVCGATCDLDPAGTPLSCTPDGGTVPDAGAPPPDGP